MTCRGDPSDEDAVGVLDEMVSSERIDKIPVAAQVRRGDGDDLPIAGRRCESPGLHQELVSIRSGESRDDELVDVLVRVGREHRDIVEAGADTVLTRDWPLA
jgi:hypothetical protein